MEYIESHLDGEIDIAQAARLAVCSSFHFQRVSSYMAGVTLTEYIRRRRMTLAAFEPAESGAQVRNALGDDVVSQMVAMQAQLEAEEIGQKDDGLLDRDPDEEFPEVTREALLDDIVTARMYGDEKLFNELDTLYQELYGEGESNGAEEADGSEGREVQLPASERGRGDDGAAERVLGQDIRGSGGGVAEADAGGAVQADVGTVRAQGNIGEWTAEKRKALEQATKKIQRDFGIDAKTRPVERISPASLDWAKSAKTILGGEGVLFYDDAGEDGRKPNGFADGKHEYVRYTGKSTDIFHYAHERAHNKDAYLRTGQNRLQQLGKREILDAYIEARGAQEADRRQMETEFLCDVFGAYVYGRVMGRTVHDQLGLADDVAQAFYDAFDAAFAAGAIEEQEMPKNRWLEFSETEIMEPGEANAEVALYTESQYNRYDWARVNGVLTAGENRNFVDSIRRGDARRIQKRTSDGYYIVETSGLKLKEFGLRTVLVVTDGKRNDPSIERVYRIDIDNDTDAEIVREAIYEIEKRDSASAGEIIKNYFGEKLVRYSTNRDFETYRTIRSRRSQQQGKRGAPHAGINRGIKVGRGDSGKNSGDVVENNREAPATGAFSAPENELDYSTTPITDPGEDAPRTRRGRINEKAGALFDANETPESYFARTRETGEEFDNAVNQQLRGMMLRNGENVGGTLSDASMERIAGIFAGATRRNALSLSLSSPVRVFEDVTGWGGRTAEERAKNVRNGNLLKNTYYEYGNLQAANRETWIAENMRPVIEATTKQNPVNSCPDGRGGHRGCSAYPPATRRAFPATMSALQVTRPARRTWRNMRFLREPGQCLNVWGPYRKPCRTCSAAS